VEHPPATQQYFSGGEDKIRVILEDLHRTIAQLCPSRGDRSKTLLPLKRFFGDAPDFVEVGEAGIAAEDSMRHLRCLQLVG
jgi:hypothetical protein